MLDDAQQPQWPAMIQDLVQHYMVLWHASDTCLPWLGPAYSSGVQRSNGRHLDHFLAAVSAELKCAPQTESQLQAMWARIGLALMDVARATLGADERALETLLGCGFLEATTEFARMARRFDPTITSEDIYQAGRNVWTANFLQLLLGIPVRVTLAIFAYSMLYSYSDNYLDDPAISTATKLAFNARFGARLAGEPLAPRDRHEQISSDLVGIIEGQFRPRALPTGLREPPGDPPGARQEPAAIAPQSNPAADRRARDQLREGRCLGAGRWLLGGRFADRRAARMYLWLRRTNPTHGRSGRSSGQPCQPVPHDLLLDRRAAAAGHGHQPHPAPVRPIVMQLDGLGAADLGPFKDLIARSVNLLLIDAAGRSARLYSRHYLRELETHAPVRFAALRRQRKQLAGQQFSLLRLIDLLVAPALASARS